MYLVYIIAAFACGYTAARKLKHDGTVLEHTAMAVGIGTLISGWVTYIVSYAAKTCFSLEHPKVYGNITAILICVIIACIS